MPKLTAKQIDHSTANKIYSLLVEECGASEYRRAEFNTMVVLHRCQEYRFGGSLGFGGKFYVEGGDWWVSCYREDETPERIAAIERTNQRLAEMYSHFQEAK